jgi:hypothetical protein
VQHRAGDVEAVAVPTQVPGFQTDVVELTDRKAAQVEPRIELGDRQDQVTVGQPDGEAPADDQSAQGEEERAIGGRRAGVHHGCRRPECGQHVQRAERIPAARRSRTRHDTSILFVGCEVVSRQR